ncbi:MAG TPA: glycosyl hydrolase-related protein, partial [Chitinophagaceae bacterium]|nr:glycosyl hydrolase-related protein [Chitinophagaceae bacterium]
KTYPVLPKETVSYGNEWDLYCASMNETTARVRRATEKLRNAEAVASVASLKNEVFLASLAPQRRLAWEAYGLYWEHDWTADGPVSKKDRADWQIKMQQRISTYSDSLLALSVSTLGKQLRSSGKRCFFVFNALGWKRNDIADFKYGGPYPVQVIDQSTGEEVPSQLIIKGSEKYLRLLASDVPAVGYKTFEIREGKPAISPPAAVFDGKYLRNRFYRLRLTRSGAITELYDSLAGSRQLAALADGRYINDIGAVDVNHGEPLVVESAGPVSLTLKAVSNDPLPHAVRITLFKHSPRIEIEDSLLANFSDVKTWSFSFNLNDAVARHEELGSELTAKKENHGGHYAAVNARYDWLTFNHFADVSEKRYGITLSNLDCSFFKLGQSTPDSLWEFSAQVNALAGGQTDNLNDSTSKKNLGIVAQNGDSAFLYHFALQTHSTPFDATSSMKYSLEHVNPLVTGVITGMADASPRTSYSLVSIDQPDVILWGIKPAEEEKGALVARWWNLGNQRKHAVVRFSEKVEEVWRTSHIETPEVRASLVHENLSIPLNQHQLATYKIIVKESRPVAK